MWSVYFSHKEKIILLLKDVKTLKKKHKREKMESNKELGKHNRCDDNLYTWLGIVSDMEE